MKINPRKAVMTDRGDPVVVLDHDGTWLFGRVGDHHTVWCMADGSYAGVSGMWSGVRLVNVPTGGVTVP